MYTYHAEVNRWIDGDTVELTVDIGFNVSYNGSFRIRGLYCPELREAFGKEAKELSASIFPPGSKITIQTIKPPKTEKYGRYLIDLPMLVNKLVEAGYGRTTPQ